MDLFVGALLIIGAVVLVVGIVLLAVAYATKQKLKMPLIVMGVAVGLMVVGFGSMAAWNHHVEQERQAEIAQKRELDKAMDKKFDQAYANFYASGYLVAIDSENLGNKVQKAWNSAIFDDGGAKVGGKSYTDFNKAIAAVMADQASTLTKIDDELSTVNSSTATMQKFKTNARDSKYKQAVSAQKKIKHLANVVTDPTGNISDFSSNFSAADNAVADAIKQ